jgi:phosphoribosyl-dephospho-CoA transferase
MLARHDLLWLSGEGWHQALASIPADAAGAGAAIARWREADWPVIVRRADAGLGPEQVSVGIALPPAEDGRKLRIACRAGLDTVRRHASPLPLAQVAQCATMLPSWHAPLAALARNADKQGIALRVYGSAALQAITGQPFLRDSSDIDLLVRPRAVAELDAALALLREHATKLPLDGEIVFPGGRAVAWKELLAAREGSPASRVLVKEMARVSLVRFDALLASLEEAACPN